MNDKKENHASVKKCAVCTTDSMQFFNNQRPQALSLLTVDLKSANGFHQQSVLIHSEGVAGPAAHRAVVKVRGDGVKG